MFLPRIIHRIWIGSMPTEEQLGTLLDARLCVTGKVELWLWTTSSIASRFQRENRYLNNIVIRNINSIWHHPFAREAPVTQLKSLFERESRGAFYNYAAASDIARLMILYCYGGIYLDMDVQFKTSGFCLFSNLSDIGDRLGMYVNPRGKYGNGVLVSRPRSVLVKTCLQKIKDLYCSGTKVEISWKKKRDYGAIRVFLTVNMSGPQVIYNLARPEQLYPIKESKYFAPIDAGGSSYNRCPGLMRRDSVPDLTR